MSAVGHFRKCLIQGGSRGIGYEFVKQLLAKPGVDLVVATCRHPDQSENLKRLQEQYSSRLLCVPLDLTEPESIASAAEEVNSHVGDDKEFQFLLNSSGFLHDSSQSMMPERKVDEVTYEKMLRNFQVEATQSRDNYQVEFAKLIHQNRTSIC